MRSYRYNVMELNTPETFVGVRGGLRGDVRDVYFARALGTAADYAKRIEDIDRRMDVEAALGRSQYIRRKGLPSIAGGAADLTKWAGLYDKWMADKTTALFNEVSNSKSFEECAKEALEHVTELFRSSGANRSDSMVRNYAAKLLFWTAEVIGKKHVGNWNEQTNIKIILEDITKEQEYLFCYFLTRVGADVMILLPIADLEISGKLKELSQTLMIGPFGQVDIRPYSPAPANPPQHNKPKKSAPAAQTTAPQPVPQQPAPHPAPQQPAPYPAAQRPAPHPAPQQTTQYPAAQQATPSPAPQPATQQPGVQPAISRSAIMQAGSQSITQQPSIPPRVEIPPHSGKHSATAHPAAVSNNREKSYEELARLASSIVMIAVHDNKGEVLGTGSGIMIGAKGFIITNCHVIRGGAFFSVRIEDDDNIYTTDEVIKYNSSFDLAVIRIRRTLQPLPIYDGREKLVRGQKVVAIGSPLGMFNSVSDGIISGFRKIKDIEMVQFTAPTSPGSSGGAVLNMQGEVIGISTAGLDNGQNINLAVPYDSIRLMANGFF